MNSPALPAASSPPSFQRVYVWELPIRFYHWLNALCILVLTATGFIIADPPALASAGEASHGYWFGTTRFIHFATGYLLVCAFALRVYWGFVGNQYASWRNFLPLRFAQLREVANVVRVDLLQTSHQPIVSVGHNALAYLTYMVLFLVTLFQIASGFALYAGMSEGWLPRAFTWMIPLFGGDAAVRQWHHLATWFFILFTMIHVYLVFYHDYVEGQGVLSSMAGGWKFLPRRGNGATGGGANRSPANQAPRP